jgi:hypothetical protein
MTKSKPNYPIIQYNNNLSFQRYEHGWILRNTTTSEKRINKQSGEMATYTRESFYPNLQQTLNAIMDREVGECETLVEIKDYLVGADQKVQLILSQLDIYNV